MNRENRGPFVRAPASCLPCCSLPWSLHSPFLVTPVAAPDQCKCIVRPTKALEEARLCIIHLAPGPCDSFPSSSLAVMWYVLPVKRGCCRCSLPVVAVFSLPSSFHLQSPLCTARAPTSWHSPLQPHCLSGERQAQAGASKLCRGRVGERTEKRPVGPRAVRVHWCNE